MPVNRVDKVVGIYMIPDFHSLSSALMDMDTPVRQRLQCRKIMMHLLTLLLVSIVFDMVLPPFCFFPSFLAVLGVILTQFLMMISKV